MEFLTGAVGDLLVVAVTLILVLTLVAVNVVTDEDEVVADELVSVRVVAVTEDVEDVDDVTVEIV